MRRLEGVTGTRHSSRANGAKTKHALFIQCAAAIACEIFISGNVGTRIVTTRVTPGRICPPDFYQSIENRRAGIVPDTARQLGAAPSGAALPRRGPCDAALR